MPLSFSRRRLLKSSLALGAALASPIPARALEAATGRALLGFQVPSSFNPLLEETLGGLQGVYRPDLGRKPVLMPGGSGAVAVESLLRAPPDGSTVLIAPSAFLTLLPAVRKLSNDPVERLIPVAGIGETTVGFIVGPAVPDSVRTMSDYCRWASANAVSATYAVPGLGTAMHFVAREVCLSADVRLKAVNYRGPQPIIQDVAAGTIPAAFTVLPDPDYATVHPTIRLLAVASDQRWPSFPQVPTFIELKMMQKPALESLGFLFAEGTPQQKVDELSAAVREATARPAVLRLMASINMRPMPAVQVSYATVLGEERKLWSELARRVGTET